MRHQVKKTVAFLVIALQVREISKSRFLTIFNKGSFYFIKCADVIRLAAAVKLRRAFYPVRSRKYPNIALGVDVQDGIIMGVVGGFVKYDGGF